MCLSLQSYVKLHFRMNVPSGKENEEEDEEEGGGRW